MNPLLAAQAAHHFDAPGQEAMASSSGSQLQPFPVTTGFAASGTERRRVQDTPSPLRPSSPFIANQKLQEHREEVGLTPPPTPYLNDNRMVTPALDVFVLTFNCGKEAVDANVFARHLRSALTLEVEHPTSGNMKVEEVLVTRKRIDKLPDLVVL